METIKKHSDFMMPEDTPIAFTQFMIMKMRPTKFESGRYGIVATKKTFRKAVIRNRAKRLLRAMLQQNKESVVPGIDFVFILRRDILTLSFAVMSKDFRKALRKAKDLCINV
jgi:ribonuclease P protein component